MKGLIDFIRYIAMMAAVGAVGGSLIAVIAWLL